MISDEKRTLNNFICHIKLYFEKNRLAHKYSRPIDG